MFNHQTTISTSILDIVYRTASGGFHPWSSHCELPTVSEAALLALYTTAHPKYPRVLPLPATINPGSLTHPEPDSSEPDLKSPHYKNTVKDAVSHDKYVWEGNLYLFLLSFDFCFNFCFLDTRYTYFHNNAKHHIFLSVHISTYIRKVNVRHFYNK